MFWTRYLLQNTLVNNVIASFLWFYFSPPTTKWKRQLLYLGGFLSQWFVDGIDTH